MAVDKMNLAQSKLLFYQGDFQGSRKPCEEILRLLPADEIHLFFPEHAGKLLLIV